MNYIVIDLEFNQDLSEDAPETNEKDKSIPFEIIQIGAIKLDSQLNTLSSFNRLIKPTIYEKVSPFITILTGIDTNQLISEDSFPVVYKDFIEFIGDQDSVFCTWGMSDIKELFRNVKYHQLNYDLLPKKYINLQPYASLYFGISSRKLLRLQTVVEALNIPIDQIFHNALSDAYYTAEIFKKINSDSIEINTYDPTQVAQKTSQPIKIIDTEGLIKQFEKMYQRTMTKEEQDIILLAYKMGKTQQFLIESK